MFSSILSHFISYFPIVCFLYAFCLVRALRSPLFFHFIKNKISANIFFIHSCAQHGMEIKIFERIKFIVWFIFSHTHTNIPNALMCLHVSVCVSVTTCQIFDKYNYMVFFIYIMLLQRVIRCSTSTPRLRTNDIF